MCPSIVAVVACESYEPRVVDAALRRGLELLGGVEAFVRPGEHIVLKPNLLVASAPDKAVTTHPEVFAATARAFIDAGASLSWGDSPGVGGGLGAGKRAGIAAVADELGIGYADFSEPAEVSFPEGDLVKQFTLARPVVQADGLITLPKLKTHALTRLTGAVKNQFGCVPGLLKGEFHVRMPDVDHFCRMLVDLNLCIWPRLAIMDAVVAMEGNGPRGGTPRQVGVLILSADLVAVDEVGCAIMDLDPELVGTVTWGKRLGLGSADGATMVGDPVPVIGDYRANRGGASTTGGAFGFPLGRRLLAPRPFIVSERCTRCGTCVNVCPVEPKAVDWPAGDRGRIPAHDYGRCIRCYCCQEMCPEHAIEVATPLLGRLIRR